MEAKELMIGNYIMLNNEFSYLSGNDLGYLDNVENLNLRPEIASAITPTNELLVKFGLNHYKPDYYSDEYKNIRIYIKNGLAHCSLGDDEKAFLFSVVSSVHELQNIYFSLTREQLKLNNN